MSMVVLRALRGVLLLACVLMASLAYGHGRPALAASFTVNDTADAVDANPGDGVCETAVANGVCTLRAAIMETDALPGADHITVPGGLYQLTLAHSTCGKAAELQGQIGALAISGDVTIEGAGADQTIIAGPGTSTCDPVFFVGSGFGGGVVRISGVTIQGGDSMFSGGGIGANYGTLTLDRVSIHNNYGGDGGGVRNQGTLIVTNSTISNNWAWFGGAIQNWYGKSVSIDNSTISNNQAAYGPGAIDNAGAISFAIAGSTIAGNLGKGVALFGAMQIRNTILANGGGVRNCGPAPTSLGHNIADDDSCSLTGPGDHDNTDPRLGPLADNGGPTQTRALLAGSPAIDAGSNDCPPPATDQRGVARPQGASCDIGAFESQPGKPLWGDVHCDGAVDSVDSLGDLRHLSHLPPLPHAGDCPEIGQTVEVTGFSPHAWGDVDCDTDVNSIDALRILRFVAHLSLTPIAGCPDVGAEVRIS